MQDIPALAEHLANMVTASDTPRYRSVLAENVRFLERELNCLLPEARAQGAAEERERLAKDAEGDGDRFAAWVSWDARSLKSEGKAPQNLPLAHWLRSNTGEG